MLGKELADLIASGARPVVTFTAHVLDMEIYLEPGMRGRLVSASHRHDGMFKLEVDLTEFDEFNKQFESANYFDKAGVACLTAREAGYYPEGNESFYAMLDQPADYLALEDDSRLQLYRDYLASGSSLNYVQWLEDRVLIPA